MVTDLIRMDDANDGDPSDGYVYREDAVVELGPAEVTPEGFLIFEGYLAKPGILEYPTSEGVRRELVPLETLHDPAALRTLRMRPVTFEHPDPGVYPDMVTSENEGVLSVGSLGESPSKARDGRVKISMSVRRGDAIRRVEQMRSSGKTLGLSPGYRCRLDFTPGVDPTFGAYDAIQKDRRYNHVAITDRPRGGASIHFRLDSEEAVKDTLINALCILGITRTDAEALVEKTNEEIIQAAQSAYDASMQAARTDGATATTADDTPDEGAAHADAKPAAKPSEEEAQAMARKQARRDRRAMDVMASEYGIDPDEYDDDDLRGAVLDKAGVTVASIDGVDMRVLRRAAYDGFVAGRPKEAKKVDAEDPVRRAFSPVPREDSAPSVSPYDDVWRPRKTS